MNEILSIHDLSVNYGGIEAVKGISFDVHEGEIVTLIGANGAGKSSTLRTIAGLVKPSGGTINFRGDNITGRDATTIVKKGITLVPEGRHIFPDLTVLENLKVGAYLRSDDISGDIQWVYDLFPRLRERSWQAGGTLSGGEQQMLAVGRALMARPKLIMMDEPSLGLAPLVVRDIFEHHALRRGQRPSEQRGRKKGLSRYMIDIRPAGLYYPLYSPTGLFLLRRNHLCISLQVRISFSRAPRIWARGA